MSLTRHLRDPGSPIRAYINGISPVLSGVLEGQADSALAAAGSGQLAEIAARELLVPPGPGVDRARAGTAVDFRTRIALGGFDAEQSTAAMGVALLDAAVGPDGNGRHRARVLTEAFAVAAQLIGSPSDEADVDRAAIVLAHCEQVYRAGSAALKGSVGRALDAAADGQEFADAIDAPSLADLRCLMLSNAPQLDVWREQIAGGERFEPNPRFTGSGLVGGADADWLISDTLIDCKAYENLTVPNLRDFIRQLLGYVLLDLGDSIGIRSVGVWLPRQGVLSVWGLGQLLGGDPEELLPVLRQGFLNAASGQQLAVRVTVTQRRKHQVLADNKHTPGWMLEDLARSPDKDIRFRVGRNAMTPEQTVRRLARDKCAKVREGVAANERAPLDLLEELSGDSSVLVRRALAANPRTWRMSTRTQPAIETGRRDDAALVRPGTERAPGRIAQVRGDHEQAWWLQQFLAVLLGGHWAPNSRIPLSLDSEIWTMRLGWSIEVPESLRSGLPDEVKDYLMRDDHPAWIRRMVAGSRSVTEPAMRDRLLADADPEIRWSVLRRTRHAPDDALGALLGELGASREARLRFRTVGDERAERGHTPTAYDKTTLELVASHPSTPVPTLRELAGTKWSDILVAVVENPSLPEGDLVSLLPRLRSMKPEVRGWLAASDRIPAVVAEMLADDRQAWIRAVLARNQAAPAEVLARLADDRELSVRIDVLGNLAAPADLAAAIAESLLRSAAGEELYLALRAVDGRCGVELPDGLLADAVEKLSRSRLRDPDLRVVAVSSEHAGVRTLARLAKSADSTVREAVAGNVRTPSEVLGVLAADPVPAVRAAAAGNEAWDTRPVSALSHDGEPPVRDRAAENPRPDALPAGELLVDEGAVQSASLSSPVTGLGDRGQVERAGTRAHQDWLPTEVEPPDRRSQQRSPLTQAELIERVTSNRAEVRAQTARDPRTPPDALAILGGERRSVRVRRVVAANPTTPANILRSLAEDTDAEVRRAVAFNTSTPPDLLVELAGRGIDLALLVALNPGAPLEIIDSLVTDDDPLVAHVASGCQRARAALMGDGPSTRRAAISMRDSDHESQ